MVLVNENYFYNKNNVGPVCRIGTYLNKNGITDGDLDDNDVLTNILRSATLIPTGKGATPNQLNTLRDAIRTITIDKLKTQLYRVNPAILLVACVECVLYPRHYDEQDDDTVIRMDTHCMIYSGEERAVTEAFNKLSRNSCRHTPAMIKSVKSFFKIERLIRKNIEYLEPIREYLNTIEIGNEESEFIRKEMLDTL
uniref:Uncharacterized protein n=1 Tax=Trichogramma kaykai TaxID=54128 RepID=A0ABD2VT56_9HYME